MNNRHKIKFEALRTGNLQYKHRIVINNFKFKYISSRFVALPYVVRCTYKCTICGTTALMIYNKWLQKITNMEYIKAHTSKNTAGDDQLVKEKREAFVNGMKLLKKSYLRLKTSLDQLHQSKPII